MDRAAGRTDQGSREKGAGPKLGCPRFFFRDPTPQFWVSCVRTFHPQNGWFPFVEAAKSLGNSLLGFKDAMPIHLPTYTQPNYPRGPTHLSHISGSCFYVSVSYLYIYIYIYICTLVYANHSGLTKSADVNCQWWRFLWQGT